MSNQLSILFTSHRDWLKNILRLFWRRDNYKIITCANTDGLVSFAELSRLGGIGCLRQPGQILNNLNVYHRNLHLLIILLHREQSCIRDKVYGAVVLRTVVMPTPDTDGNYPYHRAVRFHCPVIRVISCWTNIHDLKISITCRDSVICQFYLDM